MKSRSAVLILSIAAMVAASALAAPVAQAAVGKFTTSGGVYPAIITGDQDGGVTKFIVGKEIRVITCVGIQYDATIVAATESLTVTPTYGGCKAAPGAVPTNIRTHKCTYTLSVPNGALSSVTTDLTNCPEAEPLEFEIAEAGGSVLCVYEVKSQSGLPGITWTNKAGPPEDITLELEVKPLAKVLVGSAIVCGAAKGNNVAAVLKGSSTIRAYEDGAGIEGNQIGVMVG